jgi:16S rRNA (adenine1518-N6/adenine1519-N6)-dimethyltransferase
MRPKKYLGQHFLRNTSLLQKIVSYAALKKEDVVVEIGAGRGDLTAFIAQQVKILIALELDPNLIFMLKKRFNKNNNVIVVCEDALTFDYKQISEHYNSALKIIGNIPYYLSTVLIKKLLKMKTTVILILFMLQKEVAERIISVPGSKSYGPLSIISQIYANTSKLMDIEKSYFSPSPKVDSSLIKFELYQKPKISISDEEYFDRALHFLFAQRRKTILNTLIAFEQKKRDEVVRLCKEASIDPIRRAETLTIEEIDKLIRKLKNLTF